MTNETRNGAQWSADVDEELLVTLPANRGDVTQTPLPLDHPRARVRRLRPMAYGILKSEGSFFCRPQTHGSHSSTITLGVVRSLNR